MTRRALRSLTVGLLVLLLLPIMGITAAASDLGFTYYNWPTLTPAYYFTEYDPDSVDDCASGKAACVDKVIKDMRSGSRRWPNRAHTTPRSRCPICA